MTNNLNEIPNATAKIEPEGDIQEKAGVLLKVCTMLIILLNVILCHFVAPYRTGQTGLNPGYVFGCVVIFPFLVVGIFQIWKCYRSNRSKWKVFFGASIVVLLTLLQNLETFTQQQP